MMGYHMTEEEIKRDILEKLSVPLWPHTGWALNLKRGATYDAERRGKIPTTGVSRKKDVPTAWIRNKLNINPSA
jgi:hypothetical protein